jgi:imidazolonepropionase
MSLIDADLLIDHASQVVTCAAPAPKRGAALADVGIIPDGAVAVAGGVIVAVGSAAEVRAQVRARETVDAGGRALIPGLIDCHTHLVYGGDRAGEFEMRIRGASYVEIMAAGGGILNTMRQTRAASVEALVKQAEPRLREMAANGATTVEIKTGYGLDLDSELRMLAAIERLAGLGVCEIVPTVLAAHTVPPEFKDDPDGYVDEVVGRILPAAAAWHAGSRFASRGIRLGVDVFCENHAFTVTQSQRVLEAGARLGMAPKIHVDQFTALGGVEMALAAGALSCDHLEATTPADAARLGASGAAAVVLPACAFNFGNTQFADARGLVNAGAALALATDHNPGSAPCLSLPLVMAIACRYQRLLPAEALNAVTINAAHALGLADKIGSIEVGKRADLLLVNGPDYRALAYTFGGRVVRQVR